MRLALDAGVLVRAERIIEDLWAMPPARAATRCSRRCRSCAGVGRAGRDRGQRAGYTLTVATEAVMRSGCRAGGRGGRTATRWRRGRPWMWRGGPGAVPGRGARDAGDGDWLHATGCASTRSASAWSKITSRRRVDLGAGGDVIGELEGLVDRYPLREGLWSNSSPRCTALGAKPTRSPRTAGSAPCCRRAGAGAGTGPTGSRGPDPAAEPGARRRRWPRAGHCGVERRQPPCTTAPLVGRAGELAAFRRLVQDHRLVTVVGPAGVGETRLAIEVARRAGAPGGRGSCASMAPMPPRRSRRWWPTR